MSENDTNLNSDLNNDKPKTALSRRRERIAQERAERIQAQQTIRERSVEVLEDEDYDESDVDDEFRNDERDFRSRPSRPSRYAESMSKNSRPNREEMHFIDEATLRNIPARPGFVQRWVRVNLALSKDPDVANYDRKIQQGWTPRAADTVPGYKHPDMNIGTSQDVIRIAGHILMERPVEVQKQHLDMIRAKTERMTSSLHLSEAEALQGNKYFGAVHVDKRKVVAEKGLRPVKVAD